MAILTDLYNFTASDLNTGSLTAVNVPQMLFAIPTGADNRAWAFEFTLIIGSSSAAGLKVALTVPAGAQFRAWAMGSGASKNAMVVDLMNVSGALGAAFNTFIGQTNYLRIRGGILSGTAAGNVQLQAAKVTSGTATLSAGSFFTAHLL